MAISTQTRDRAIYATLDHYGKLPSNWIAYLVEGGYTQGFRRRLQDLKRAKRIAPSRGQFLNDNDESEFRKTRHVIYERVSKGQKHYSKVSAHNLMASLIEASFQIAAPKLGLRFVSWEEMTAHPDMPYITASSHEPFKLTAEW